MYNSDLGVGTHLVITMGLYNIQNERTGELKEHYKGKHLPCTALWEIEYEESDRDWKNKIENFDMMNLYANQTLKQIDLFYNKHNESNNNDQRKDEL